MSNGFGYLYSLSLGQRNRLDHALVYLSIYHLPPYLLCICIRTLSTLVPFCHYLTYYLSTILTCHPSSHPLTFILRTELGFGSESESWA